MTAPGRLRSFPWWRWLLLAALTVAATVALDALDVPSPALFAGLFVATVLALAGLGPTRVARPATAGSQAVIGIVIGLLARPETLATVATQWIPVLVISLLTLLVSMGAGLLMGLQRGVTPLTGMLAQTAGGASGLVAISRELGGDERTVAVIQYLRVGLVTATMPVVAALAYGAQVAEPAGSPPAGPAAPWWIGLGVIVACVVIGVPLGRVTRVPAGSLLGPMVVALVISLAGFSFDASVPLPIVDVAYAVIGWQAGLRFTRAALGTVVRVLPLATALILAVVAVCAGLGLLLSHFTGMTPLEGYLATTPGGIYAVLATAISSGADVTTVVAVQVLRVILMLMVAPWIARFVGRRLGAGART
ncbi:MULTISPECIES: AbrB family transcriptional regulator [unclassified Pseudonocardia]|uniref:AbrB family transcriptional regulator n=1 Tax=unclassified Pseudonocardia TaxID=2619320 RepID=UPI0001FFF346|nr:AbrB family transcriptional regulator [Pseudonocardia sp. Ae707_Ps1]OLM18448.1 putative ammonia monooxygenase [Pseudonocardia sp. Ae707_Ps1]